MKRYRFTAVDAGGRVVRDEIDAASLADASGRLLERDLQAMRVEAEPEGAAGDADPFVLFNRGLAELASLSIPLPEAMAELAERMRGTELRGAVERSERRVREGAPIEEAFAAGEFPPYYGALLRAGVAAGNLPAVLSAVAADAVRARRLERRARTAAMYPVIVLLLASCVAAAWLQWYVPAMAEVYRAAELDFPDVIALPVWAPIALVGAVIGAAGALGLAARRHPGAERLLSRVPVAGSFARDVRMLRLVVPLRLLVERGVPLVRAVPVAIHGCGSPALSAALPEIERALGEGRPLSEALPVSERLGPLRWGESRGSLADGLAETAAILEARIESRLRTFEFVAEPAATLAAGAAIVWMVVPMVEPYRVLLGRLAEIG